MGKIKWNWGTKILIAIILFMSFIFVLVYQTTKHEIFLVEKDYYPKGLKYQDRLDDIENARQFAGLTKVYPETENIIVSFPEIHPDSGTIYFFRPSNTNLDEIYNLEPDDKYMMSFSKKSFQKGKYILKISWRENGKGYYMEKPFYFN